eukprot:3686761-Pleurochrysis_carterae.AAC.1
MVPARSTLSGREVGLEPPLRMNSARRTSVSRLYAAPPGASGSTKGSRSVAVRKSLNQASAVPVRRASVTSMTRARAAARSALMVRVAGEDGSPSRHLSVCSVPRGPANPIAAALLATLAVPASRG